MADDDSTPPEKRRQEPPPIEFLKPGEPQTPPPSTEQPVAWVTRPEDYQRPAYPVAPAPPRQGAPGRYGVYAGILLILAAGFGIASTIVSALTIIPYSVYLNFTNDTATFVTNQICGLIIIWSEAAALLGGVMAFQRINWRLTMICAIFATLTVGFFFEASVMGLAACVLIAMARKEFVS